jgi:hypothetical protein
VVKVKMEKAFDYFQTSFSIEKAKFFGKSESKGKEPVHYLFNISPIALGQ